VELVRQRTPVLIISHQATLRVLYAYLTDMNPASCPEVLVPLLGSDAVAVLAFDADSGALAVKQMLALPAGSGPRHIAMHPSNFSRAYLALELSSSLAQLHRREGDGRWEVAGGAPPLSTLRSSTGLPAPTVQAAAAIVLSPDAAFLYVSNRASPAGTGDNSLACFALGADGGVLGAGPTSWATGGAAPADALFFPRDFAVSPAGDAVVAANQLGGSITLFSRDRASGELAWVRTLPSAPVSSPSFVHLR
jgi:6-phosphogluconolactonase